MKLFIASVPIVIALMASGCATKKFVRQQIEPVNDRLTATNDQLAALATKHQTDVSRLDERITTTDNKLAATTATADAAYNNANQANAAIAQVDAAAARAMQTAQAGNTRLTAESAALAKMQADMIVQAKALDYTLAETGNVTFGFNRIELSDDAKVILNAMIQKASAAPRPMLEVVGFADTVGSKSYNMTLSQQRAEEVARYLVRQNIPLKNISILGLGEEQTPEQLAEEVKGVDANATPAQLRGLARRVRVRLYVPATAATSTAGTGRTATDAAQ